MPVEIALKLLARAKIIYSIPLLDPGFTFVSI